MKNFIFLIVLVACGYCILKYALKRAQAAPSQPVETANTALNSGTGCASSGLFFRTASGSIRKNGVEIVSSAAFAPYYNDTHRSIELNVGFIASVTAKTLITLHLPAATFRKPMPIDLTNIPFTDRKGISNAYQIEVRNYEADSMAFYAERAKRIKEFRGQIDSELNKYNEQEAKQ